MMSRYGELVTVTLAASHDERPTSFTWRGRRYWIGILATWRLRSRCCRKPSDRSHYLVLCADLDHQRLYDLSHDHVTGVWLLDAIAD